MARWAAGRPSILTTAPSHVHLFWQSFAGLDLPDLQCVFTPGSYQQGKLAQQPGITAHLDPAAIARFTDPANYLGAAPSMVDRVLRAVPRPGGGA